LGHRSDSTDGAEDADDAARRAHTAAARGELAGQGKAGQGKARQGKAKQSKAEGGKRKDGMQVCACVRVCCAYGMCGSECVVCVCARAFGAGGVS
jgi:hypothetical protein